ncbi:MAG: hypothetical protein RMJ84_09315 [Sandaracinaceae bacterium]|nr:hypothetical protein [Sandaracinaceae bacterium]
MSTRFWANHLFAANGAAKMSESRSHGNESGNRKHELLTQSYAKWFSLLSPEEKEAFLELRALVLGMMHFRSLHERGRTKEGISDSIPLILAWKDALSRALELASFLVSRHRSHWDLNDIDFEQLIESHDPIAGIQALCISLSNYWDLADALTLLGYVPLRAHCAFEDALIRDIRRNPLVRFLSARPIEATDSIDFPVPLSSVLSFVRKALDSYKLLLGEIRLLYSCEIRPSLHPRFFVLFACLRSDSLKILSEYASRDSNHAVLSFEKEFNEEILQINQQKLKDCYHDFVNSIKILGEFRSILVQDFTLIATEIEYMSSHIRELMLDGRFEFPQSSLQNIERRIAEELMFAIGFWQRSEVEKNRLASYREQPYVQIWAIERVISAFLEMASECQWDIDNWKSFGSFRFVRDFISHFSRIGIGVIRQIDYSEKDQFYSVLNELWNGGTIRHWVLPAFAKECEKLLLYLRRLLNQIPEINVEFAREWLRAYLRVSKMVCPLESKHLVLATGRN